MHLAVHRGQVWFVTSDQVLRESGAALRSLLEDRYGLAGELTALPGEVDANLRLHNADGSWLVKVVAPDGDLAHVDLQIAVLDHLERADLEVETPRVVRTRDDDARATIELPDGERHVWLSSWLEGEVVADRPVVTPELAEDIGRKLGEVATALASFDDPRATRPGFKWDLGEAAWIGTELTAIDSDRVRRVVGEVHDRFERWLAPRFAALPRTIAHNDANDHNLMASPDGRDEIVGLFDFGDLCETARIADVAIAAAYAALRSDEPLTAIDAVARGFDAVLPLTGTELSMLVPLVETRLAVSITNAAVQQRLRPDDPYVTVSADDARRVLLQIHGRHPRVAEARVRTACGRPMGELPHRVREFLIDGHASSHAILPTAARLDRRPVLDLSFESVLGGDDPLRFDAIEAELRIARELRAANSDFAIGRYLEPRPIYTAVAFGDDTPPGRWRTVHLGIDVFAPTGTFVHAPLAATVAAVHVCEDELDYGGLVVLAHTLPDGSEFCTLYGHLARRSIAHLEVGQSLVPGATFARVGDRDENGGWPPHLHLQVLAMPASELGSGDPESVPRGVADPDDVEAHAIVSPDPSPLLGAIDDRWLWRASQDDSSLHRSRYFNPNLRVSYRAPVSLVRGNRHFVFDRDGRRYLDAYNNVPHVGHCHPRVVEAVQRQTALLATNTRYLHPGMYRYADRLRHMLPPDLEVFFFTASGSEANELALRLARAHTGRRDVCVMDHGYHGHTNETMAISPYKFRQRGAPPQPDWVHVTAQPDVYRGPHRGDDAGERYAADVGAVVARMLADGRAPAAYISECLPSVGGQLELPPGFLTGVYAAIRDAGGICIADDVQTALWRTGTHAFGFEAQDVVPDVLVLGKPLGNGFPLAAVVSTREVAASFAEGPEFFSTFGGSTVAMAAGLAVLDALDDEDLADNARRTGDLLLDGLRELQQRHERIGDVRGRGFFLGVELVRDRASQTPATELASLIKNRLRQRRVLIGTDGPHDNVLKIRPPMTFDRAAADCLLQELATAFDLAGRTDID